MFRALILPPVINDTLVMQPPLSASILRVENGDGSTPLQPVNLRLRPSTTFSTTVGASSKKTLAKWHVTSPGEVVDAMFGLVGKGEEV